MKRGKKLALLIMFVFMVIWGEKDAYAAQPYEQIANTPEWEVLKLVNKARLENGREAVAMFSALQKASGVRAKEIVELFDHTRPDGSSCFTVLSQYNISCGGAGENIAAGYSSPEAVMLGWLNSEGHRRNILTESYTHVGIGYYEGGSYRKNWSQMFISGCNLESVKMDQSSSVSYPEGTEIESMDRYLVVQCDKHGVGYVPVISQMCKGYHKNQTGAQTVTVTYQGTSLKVPITIVGENAKESPQSNVSGSNNSGSSGSNASDTGDSTSQVKKPYQIKNLKVTAKSKKAVRLAWSKRTCDGYEIWRATSAKGKYKKVATVKTNKTTKYRVTKLKSGKKYYFKVRAYKKSGKKKVYGKFSKAVVVKTK